MKYAITAAEGGTATALLSWLAPVHLHPAHLLDGILECFNCLVYNVALFILCQLWQDFCFGFRLLPAPAFGLLESKRSQHTSRLSKQWHRVFHLTR